MKNKTSIIIAHRLSTIKKVDEIIVLNRGEIAESGKHKELMSKKGMYYNLVKMQEIWKKFFSCLKGVNNYFYTRSHCNLIYFNFKMSMY